MAFEQGNQLHLLGRKAKRITESLERAMLADDGAKIRLGIDKLLDAFAAGEPWAIEQVWSRHEGKATVALTVNDDRSTLREYTVAQLMQIIAEQGSQGKQALTIDQVSEQSLIGVGECTGVAVDGGVGTEGVECSNSPTKTV